MATCSSPMAGGWMSVVGGSLVQLTLGVTYSYGNMYPYVVSYIRAYADHASDLTETEAVWIGACSTMMHGLTGSLSGVLSNRFKPRLVTLTGAVIMTLGILLSWLAVKRSFYTLLVTYGLMVGLGGGLAYIPVIECVVKWFPLHKGLVAGIVVGGYGGGALLTNLVATQFINPHNHAPTLQVGNQVYFDKSVDGDLLSRVPSVFIVLAGIYGGLQLVGLLLIRNPPSTEDPLDIPDSDQVPVDYLNVAVVDRTREPDECRDMTPFEVLRTKEFYMLWFTLLFNTQCGFYVISLYKVYGETFIYNDHLLAVLGSVAALFNSFGRVIWGTLVDKFSYRTTMMCLCAAMLCWLVTLPACQHVGTAMFFVWICGIFGTYCGNFALLPVASAKAFGRKYMAINYGLLLTTLAVTSPIGAALSTVITEDIGWTYLFMLPAGLSFLSLILTFFLRLRTTSGNEI